MAGESLTWALLAPFPPPELSRRAEAIREALVDKGTGPWEVIGGVGAYSALLDRDPAAEYAHEIPLAQKLSKETDQPVYALYLHRELAGPSAVDEYRAGRKRRSLPDSPQELAARLGCPLPGFEAAAPVLRGVVVVEGADREQVARALGGKAAGRLRILDQPRGALLHAEPVGDPPSVARDLSRAFPASEVYTVTVGPVPGRFVCRVFREGRVTGLYGHPEPVKGGPVSEPHIDSVKGETEPAAIADQLGVPHALLGLE